MFLKWDEVYIGDGVMDYEIYLKRLAELPPDTPCHCEHLSEERDYALNFPPASIGGQDGCAVLAEDRVTVSRDRRIYRFESIDAVYDKGRFR